jgi:Phospholipase_D-nuclease N-terminal
MIPIGSLHPVVLSAITAAVGAAAFVPLVIVLAAFATYCLVDLVRAEEGAIRYLPRWVWAIICLISIPLGGIVYLIVGRKR